MVRKPKIWMLWSVALWMVLPHIAFAQKTLTDIGIRYAAS